MKTINLYFDFEFTSLSPDGFVFGKINELKKNDIISEVNPVFYNYLLRCPFSKNIFYVGKGTKRRCLVHEWNVRHGNDDCNPHKYRKIKSIIANNGNIEIVIVACGITEHESLINERILIQYFGRNNLTNLSDGGEINPMSNPITREKIRHFHVGRKRSDKTRLKQSILKKGIKLQKVHCFNISKSLLNNCYAGKNIKITNILNGEEYVFNSMLKAEKVIPITHEHMSRTLKKGNGVSFIKNFKLEYYEK